MKKIIALCLFVALVFASCSNDDSSPVLQKPEKDKIDLNGSSIKLECNSMHDVTVDSEAKIYITDNKDMKVFDNKGKTLSTFTGVLEEYSKISKDKNYLYVLSANMIKLLNLDGKLIKEVPIEEKECRKIIGVDKKVFVLTGHEGKVIMVDLDSGKSNTLGVGKATGISLYKDNRLLVSIEDSHGICFVEYDYKKMKRAEEYECECGIIGDIYFNPEDNVVYAVKSSSIVKIVLDSGEVETVLNIKNAVINKIMFSKGTLYATDMQTGTVHFWDKGTLAKENDNSLTIITLDPNIEMSTEIKAANELLSKKYPDTQVKFKSVAKDVLGKKLMAGDDDFDIFCYDEMNRDDIMEGLDKYASIVSRFDDTFEGLKGLCSYKGKLLSVPYDMMFEGFEVNNSLAKKLGVKVPDNEWTWDEFYDLAKAARQDINNDGEKDTYILNVNLGVGYGPYFLDRCLCTFIDYDKRRASFDSSEFKDILKLWKKLKDEDLVKFDMETEPFIINHNILFNLAPMHMAMGDRNIIYPPVIKGKNVYSITIMNFFFINKNSSKKNLAAEFLSQWLSKSIQINPSRGIIKDLAVYNVNDANLKISSKKNYSVYSGIINKSRLPIKSGELGMFMKDTINSYMEGMIPVEEAAGRINDKANMILGE